MLRKVVNMGRGLRVKAVEGSLWTSESPRIMAAGALGRVTVNQERGE